MAHGMTNPVHTHVCEKDIRVIVRKEDKTIVEHYFPAGEKVDLEGLFGFYSDGLSEYGYWHRLSQAQVESINDDTKLYYQLDENYYGDYLYVDKSIVTDYFRPIVHKHLSTKLFTEEDKMNDFLATLKIDCLKDIKIGNNAYLVIYIDMGDDE